MEANY